MPVHNPSSCSSKCTACGVPPTPPKDQQMPESARSYSAVTLLSSISTILVHERMFLTSVPAPDGMIVSGPQSASGMLSPWWPLIVVSLITLLAGGQLDAALALATAARATAAWYMMDLAVVMSLVSMPEVVVVLEI